MLYRRNRDHIDVFLGLYIRVTLLVFVFLLILQISQLVEKFWQSFFLLLLTGSLVLQLGFVAYVEIGIKALRKKKISYLELSIMAGLTVVMLFLTLLLLYYNQKRI
jgi:phosphatidylserine synthase